ncbi:MAG: hypothetical protein SFX73_13430 [Kofleriaceae bacterium]|nr:hypothetical protein [Kofleriaceae bacterium]
MRRPQILVAALLLIGLVKLGALAEPAPGAPTPIEPSPAEPSPAVPAAGPPGASLAPPGDAVEEAEVSVLPSAPTPAPTASRAGLVQRNFAGSVQLDYLAVPTMARARRDTLDGATVETSLKLAVDVGEHASTHVKLCVACHGPEIGMAYVELRGREELNLKAGRFTPAFGSFPIRHDPANHRTSDKPLPYDMGRMLAYREWNEGILPAPWVDNGVELYGTHFFGRHQLDYAAYAIGGPKGTAERSDFDFTLSRSGERYYVDNNSQPTVGGRAGLTLALSQTALLSLGGSTMAGRYDPDARLGFLILGADVVLQAGRTFLRAEYLARWTQIDLGEDPAGRYRYGPTEDGYADVVLKDGFYVELEHPLGRLDLIARWDGLRRFGNVLVGSPLRSESILLRYTGGAAIRIGDSMRIKTSVERYDFSDLDDQIAVHLGLVGTF